MSFVKLTFKNRDSETYEVGGSVKVEVPTTTVGLLSLSFHPESLLGVEFLDVPSLEPEAEAIPEASDEEIAAIESAPEKPAPKKPAAKAKAAVKKTVAKKPAAKKKGSS